MIWRILLLSLLGFLAGEAGAEWSSGYYVVSESFSDNGALFSYHVIEVKPDGPDTIVRYIRVAPLSKMCSRRVIVEVRETKLRDTTPADVAGQSNPCHVDATAFDKALERYPQKANIFEAVSFGIVARCGSRTTALGLPISQNVQLSRFVNAYPDMGKLWDLSSTIMLRAFGQKGVFNNIPEADFLDLQRSGADLVPGLMSGRYDQGLAEATKVGSGWKSPSFRELLKDYGGPINSPTLTPRLVGADAYKFTRYVDPVYPMLAESVRIQGRVELRLRITRGTGEVINVKRLSGHPMLIQSAVAAAKQWQFAPDSLNSKSVKVVLDYSLRCP